MRSICTSAARAPSQCHARPCNHDAAVIEKSANLLHILPAAGIDSRVHLTRIHAPHCTRGGSGPATQSDSQTGFTLPLVLHRPCARFGNNQRVSDNHWQRLCPPTLVDQRTTQCRSARTIAGYIHCLTEPLLCAQPARIAAPLVQLARAQFRAIAGTPIRNEHTTATRTASSWLHTMHRNSAPRMSQLLGRFSEIEDFNRV